MRQFTPPRWLRLWTIVPLFCTGCGFAQGGAGPTPSSLTARGALESSLTAWKDGKKPGAIEGATPPIQVVDSTWQAGAKLASFEILREEPGEPEKRFTVRLVSGTPPVALETRYMVVGTDPIGVYREDDYKRMLNMENNPAPAHSGRATRPRGR
jgi:hypothetical protein